MDNREHICCVQVIPAEDKPLLKASTHLTSDIDNNSSDHDAKFLLYRMRWFVLLVFCLLLGTNNFGWICFSPIISILGCYYGVSIWWLNALSWAGMITYIVLFVPVARFVQVQGLRTTAVVGACFNAVGFWLRFAGSGKLTTK